MVLREAGHRAGGEVEAEPDVFELAWREGDVVVRGWLLELRT
jgi:hypothetical protein